MCLILAAWKVHPRYPLVLAANRDEFHARPSVAAAFWDDAPQILAGRDLESLGTWLGVTRAGKFAAVTNYRGGRDPNAAESRGLLVSRFLANGASAAAYVAELAPRGRSYSGYNLLAADGGELWWHSNRASDPRRLEPGIYGLGNDLLDSADLAEAKSRFVRALDSAPAIEPLFGALAPSRILSPAYGTRCSTALVCGPEGAQRFAERAYDAAGNEGETVRFELRAGSR